MADTHYYNNPTDPIFNNILTDIRKNKKIDDFLNKITPNSYFIWKMSKKLGVPRGIDHQIAYDFFGIEDLSKIKDINNKTERDKFIDKNKKTIKAYINDITNTKSATFNFNFQTKEPGIFKKVIPHIIFPKEFFDKTFIQNNYMIGFHFYKQLDDVEYAFFSIEIGKDGYDIINDYFPNSHKTINNYSAKAHNTSKINNSEDVTYGSADGLVSVPNYPIVNDLEIETKFPEKYSLDKYNIKDQDLFGTCWAFAACECLNYELLKIKNELNKESNDYFSQLHMVLFNPYNVTLNSGGSYWHVMNYLSQWVGPVFKKSNYKEGLFDYELAIKLYKEFIEKYISQEEAFEICKIIVDKYKSIRLFQINFEPLVLNEDYHKKLLEYVRKNQEFYDTLDNYFNINKDRERNFEEFDWDEFKKDISKDIKKEIERRYWKEIKEYLLNHIEFDHNVHYICPNASILTNDKDKGLKDFEITNIKQALNNNKGVSISFNIKSYEKYYENLYTSKATDINHVVTIIGYDDNYPKENFNDIPKENGAFLVKNSWGKGAHNRGCFWLSYYDKNISQAVIYDLEEIPKETEIISYNKGIALGKREGKIGKTIFTMKNDGRIEAVRSYFFVGGTYITVKILVNNIVKKVFLEFIDYPGYKTFKLSNYSTLIEKIKTISCKAGDKVEIEIDYNYLNRKDSDIIPVEIEAYRLKPETKIGTCFVDGKDISSFGENLGISLLYYSQGYHKPEEPKREIQERKYCWCCHKLITDNDYVKHLDTHEYYSKEKSYMYTCGDCYRKGAKIIF